MRFSGSEASGADPGPSVVSVLVVDDDPTSRMLARAALEGHLGVVREAENGLAALNAMADERFDVAVVDLEMPVMDGFGVIERARANPETRHLPIIVVTGRDDVVAIERAFAVGATSFLCKPINWNVFRHQVGYVLKVARVEREMRAAKEHAEQVATFSQRSVAVLGREVSDAVAKISFLSGKGPEASLADIFAAGERLQTVLSRVQRASGVLTGETRLELERMPAATLAADALRKVKASVGSAAMERIEVQVPDGLEVTCDRVLAGEALCEMLENALVFSPPNRRVRIGAVDVPPDRVRFEIEDRGPGIPEDFLDDRFGASPAEAHRPSSRTRPGLGLSIAKATVEAHGGHFGMMSEPGRGAEIFLTFPDRWSRDGRAGAAETPSAAETTPQAASLLAR
jgi:CheY-like chemotaxis protein